MSGGRGAVVIPAYGKVELTRAVVADCLREPDVVRVVVVDNAGDLGDAADLAGGSGGAVEVLRPGTNLGWLRGTNHGAAHAAAAGAPWLVALNNDTRLSAGFFAGLRDALVARPDALVAPCYDDHYVAQNAYYTGPVADFVPAAVEVAAPMIDGTCYAMTAQTHAALGPLDAAAFGRRGWGAIEDYLIRARAAGLDAVVTRRAYLSHARGTTARAVMSSYERYATSEMRRGMRRKHGPHWRRHFTTGAPRDGTRIVVRDALRAVEDALGLSETAVGRRGATPPPSPATPTTGR